MLKLHKGVKTLEFSVTRTNRLGLGPMICHAKYHTCQKQKSVDQKHSKSEALMRIKVRKLENIKNKNRGDYAQRETSLFRASLKQWKLS